MGDRKFVTYMQTSYVNCLLRYLERLGLQHGLELVGVGAGPEEGVHHAHRAVRLVVRVAPPPRKHLEREPLTNDVQTEGKGRLRIG